MLAVFDATTGARIKDAEFSLELSGPGHGPGPVVMPPEAMAAVGELTYGGYISLPDSAKYRLTFDVAHAAGRRDTVKALSCSIGRRKGNGHRPLEIAVLNKPGGSSRDQLA